MKDILKELIERLEQATGPDRELANEVLLACGWHTTVTPTRRVTYWIKNPEAYPDGEQPNPLASIDSALTLVPEGMTWAAGDCGPDNDCPWACITGGHDDDYPDFDASAATPAIALVVASLKARLTS